MFLWFKRRLIIPSCCFHIAICNGVLCVLLVYSFNVYGYRLQIGPTETLSFKMFLTYKNCTAALTSTLSDFNAISTSSICPYTQNKLKGGSCKQRSSEWSHIINVLMFLTEFSAVSWSNVSYEYLYKIVVTFKLTSMRPSSSKSLATSVLPFVAAKWSALLCMIKCETYVESIVIQHWTCGPDRVSIVYTVCHETYEYGWVNARILQK